MILMTYLTLGTSQTKVKYSQVIKIQAQIVLV